MLPVAWNQAGLVRFDGMGHISEGGRVEFTVFDDSNGLNARTIVKYSRTAG